MNKAFIALATAISIAPGLAGADAGTVPSLRSQALKSPGDPETLIFTDVPGIGLVVPASGDLWGEPADVAFDSLAARTWPDSHFPRLLILYSPTPLPIPGPNKVNAAAAEPFSVLLAGVGVMGLIAQRKSRLRLALAR